jgi:tRNA pseudouridine38-40 synthase
MRKFLVKIQYNGKNYGGWQRNDNAKTIQGEVESALEKLFGESIETTGASRTDGGVSAYSYPFCFCANTKLPADRVAFKLNRYLPKDIQAFSSQEVDINFDLRKSVTSKTYQYLLYCSPTLLPLLNRDAYFVKTPLDIESMKKGASYLVGKHDLTSFSSKGGDERSHVKTIHSASVESDGTLIKITISASGFPYNGVRIIAGTLLLVGQTSNPHLIKELLDHPNREKAGLTLPPKALTLIKTEINM